MWAAIGDWFGTHWKEILEWAAVFIWENWLGKTNKVNAGSTIALVKNAVTGKPL